MIVKFMTYKVIFIITVFYNYKLKQINIKMTFLHSDLKEKVYVIQLNKYEKKKEKMYKLKKALYELKQSSCLWYKIMHWFLDSLEYTQIHVNNSVFRNSILFVAVYVDNILICRSDKNKILGLKIKLSDHFEMTNCRMCKHYLEMLVTQNRTLWMLILSQKIYLIRMLKDFSLQNVKAVTTSMKFRIYLTKTTETAKSELITQY